MSCDHDWEEIDEPSAVKIFRVTRRTHWSLSNKVYYTYYPPLNADGFDTIVMESCKIVCLKCGECRDLGVDWEKIYDEEQEKELQRVREKAKEKAARKEKAQRIWDSKGGGEGRRIENEKV